jgi:hypothetical protein
MAITVQWSHIGLGAVVAFLIGWFLFGLLGAIIIAIIVLVLMGIIRIGPGKSRDEGPLQTQRR